MYVDSDYDDGAEVWRRDARGPLACNERRPRAQPTPVPPAPEELNSTTACTPGTPSVQGGTNVSGECVWFETFLYFILSAKVVSAV